MANLIIVESPTKASTIKGYLGSGYKVIASLGHIRDLPKSTLGIDIENDFEPHYINIRGKGKLLNEIKKEAKNADKVFLATDNDREGEAISWHLATALGLNPADTRRITFNEITKTAVKSAVKAPRGIDMDLVNAQQTRRLLDRIVGYKLSPLLWKTVRSGLSAGRVQSVATRIIVDRELEIRAFVPKEYWTIDALLLTTEGKQVSASFYGDTNGKLRLVCKDDADKVMEAVTGKPFNVADVKRATKQKAPQPPFTTSTLQQEASHKLSFQSARTMRVAQELYEGINLGAQHGGVQGLITYMRTDSLRISDEARAAAKELVISKYGESYYPEKPRIYKSGSGAQDAHEAIRPSNVKITPSDIRKNLSLDQYRLYKLIWERFVSSQMQSARLNTLTVDFESAGYIFKTSGYSIAFPGYMAVYEVSEEKNNADKDETVAIKDINIPDMKKGDVLSCEKLLPAQHFTEPPARFTEASLIKYLEEKGIGRPSTYTTIITTITNRDYVIRDGKSLCPTQLGELITGLMKDKFADIVDCGFTADIETKLDGIENGQTTMLSVLNDFWKDFESELSEAEKTMASENIEVPKEETDIICEKCGSRMIIKNGRFGKFAACPNYPQCKNTKPLDKNGAPKSAPEGKEAPLPEPTGMKCAVCGANMVLRQGRYGSFYACERYPECKYTKQKVKETGVPCPKCGAKLVMKNGRNKTVFYSCERYPECDFSSWDAPTAEKCPKCGEMLFVKKGKPMIICHNKTCGYKRAVPENNQADTSGGDDNNS